MYLARFQKFFVWRWLFRPKSKRYIDIDKRILIKYQKPVLEHVNNEVCKEGMDNFQVQVGEWGEDTFSGVTIQGIMNKLAGEVLELIQSREPEEAADCLLLLLQIAHTEGYSLLEEAIKKMEINKKREWGEPDKEGIFQHIE